MSEPSEKTPAPRPDTPSADAEHGYAQCLALARDHYENFPTASNVLLGKSLAAPVAAIYAFARTADDFADEPGEGSPEERLAKLDEWQRRLDLAFAGKASDPIFIALADTATRYHLPKKLFSDLLSAFRQDVTQSRYESPEAMLDYCTRSADPVGRLVLRLHGYDDPALDEFSDAICTGLQLANFWQDVAIDLEKDRIYLPRSERERFGVTEEQLRTGRVDEHFRALLRSECDRARALFEKGRPLPDLVSGRLSLWLHCVWLGGIRILDGIERVDFDVFARRPKISTLDKLWIFARALGAWLFSRRLRALPAPAGEGPA